MNLVMCLPGRHTHRQTMESIIKSVGILSRDGWNTLIVSDYNANIFQCRNGILGVPFNINNPKPFRDEVDYDFMLWVDSDMVFQPSDCQKLIERDVDIVSGTYLRSEGDICAAYDFQRTNGRHRFYTVEDVEGKTDLIEADWTGFGFMLIKNGVFEKIGYPWFKPYIIPQMGMNIYSSEDAGFCLEAQDQGFKVFVDPTVRCGHIKERILQ